MANLYLPVIKARAAGSGAVELSVFAESVIAGGWVWGVSLGSGGLCRGPWVGCSFAVC